MLHQILALKTRSPRQPHSKLLHQNEGLSPVQLLLVLTTSLSTAPSTSRLLSQSFPSSPPMESSAVVTYGYLQPPEPPDPDLDRVFPMDPPVTPIPFDPPHVLLGSAFLCQLSPSSSAPLQQKESEALMPWDLCSDVDLKSTPPPLLLLPLAEVSLIRTLTTTERYSFLRYSLVAKLINFASGEEHDLLKSSLTELPIYHQETCVVVLFVASVLVVIADCKHISLHCSSFQSFEDWALKFEILAVNCFLNAAFITLAQSFGVYLFTAMCNSQSKPFLTWKPWVKFSSPQYEEVTLCSTTLLPHCEAVTWNCVFMAMDSIVSDWSTWLWWSYSQLLGSSKRCCVASEFVVGCPPIGYVCSVIGSWIEASDPIAHLVEYVSALS
ncbi:hypothetical protein F2Q68_00012019 [Brassica cretica]|uniref:Uncharacterized protein n=1 Tax=Brassica cretica TaxID=69181 RepID=A0A3N6QDX0_BRACR|nr:hypothetical protein F2Q68_00012019 [Brassica cretica]